MAGARLRKLDAEVELVSIQDGAIQVRLRTSGHGCGSTTKNLKAIVEESIYDLAPDLTSLTIHEPEEDPRGLSPSRVSEACHGRACWALMQTWMGRD